jgi:hypothetical protein
MELKDILIDQSKMTARKLNPFKALVENATKNKTDEEFNTLFTTFFKLENLYFVAPPREDWQNSGPFIGNINKQPCIFTFTDITMAFDFCMNTKGFQWEKDKAFIMHLPMAECIPLFKELARKGIFGIRINEGSTGFFLPMSHLEGILEHISPAKK